MLNPNLQQTYGCKTKDGESLTVVIDGLGIQTKHSDQEQRARWSAFEGIRYEPPATRVLLDFTGEDEPVELPFELCGEDGDFEDLLSGILDHLVKREDIDASESERFGIWNARKIALWVMIGFAGVMASILLIPHFTHPVIALIVAALWLMMIRYGGLSRECTITIEEKGLVLRKLWWSHAIPWAEISKLRVEREKTIGLIIDVTTRSGSTEQLTCLGAKTLEAYVAIRRAIRRWNE